MKTKRVSGAALVAIALCAAGPVLLVSGSAAALAAPVSATSAVSVRQADVPVIVAPIETSVPTTVPDPDPSPTPDPTVPPDPDPTVPPDPPATVDPVPPTDVPVPVDPVPTEVAPVPAETAAPPVVEEPVIPSDESGSGSSEEDVTETPVPTETAAPVPVPVVTATAAPAPIIELPFYPPPSAGTARDTFPFAVAGVAGALVLLAGVATYIFSRWRLRRLGFAATRGRSSSGAAPRGAVATAATMRAPRVGTAGEQSTPLALQLGFPSLAGESTGSNPAFELGFQPLASSAQSAESSRSSLQLGLAPTAAAVTAGPTIRSFLLGFTRRTENTAPEGGAGTFSVFGTRSPAPEPTKQFGLGLGLAPRAPRAAGHGDFDLGLPAV